MTEKKMKGDQNDEAPPFHTLLGSALSIESGPDHTGHQRGEKRRQPSNFRL